MPSKKDVYEQIREIRLKREELKMKTIQYEKVERKSSYRGGGGICPNNSDLRMFPLNKNLSNSSIILDRILSDTTSGNLFLSENMLV